MKKSTYLSALAAAAILSSCSNYDEPTQVFLDGELRVTAAIDQIKTRATDTDWEADDQIGISGGDFKNVAYTTTGDGSFNAVSDKIVLSEGADAITFTAYYPYAENISDDNTVEFDGETDYLWAKASAASSYSSTSASFAFSHKMSKIAFNVNDASSLTKIEDGTVQIQNIATGGTFNIETGVVTASSTKGNTSSKNFSDDGKCSFIVPCQTNKVKVIVSYNGKTFAAEIEMTLVASTQYNYSITLKEDAVEASTVELVCSNASIGGWTTEDKEGVLTEQEVENVLEVGDYLLSDGSVVDKTKYNKYKSNIVGVVYYVKGEEDEINLKNFGYEFNNGLAIALKNAGQGRFNQNNADYKTWCTNNSNKIEGLYTADMNVGSAGPTNNMFAGYNNTQIFLAAKDAKTTNSSNEEQEPLFSDELLSLLTSANNDKVTNASDWYLPNFGEFYTITANVEAINTSLKNAGGDTLVKVENYERNKLTEGWYWTSTLRGTNNAWVSIIDNTVTLTELYETRNSNGKKGYFRFAIAF